MNLEQMTERFFALVAPDLPNSWEVEDAVEHLVNEPAIDAILAQVPVIWPVSNSLCYNYLGQVTQALTCIEQAELSAWVKEILDHYEVGGLRAAQQFMTDVERNYVCHLRGESGARLQEIQGWMLPYIQGLSGADLELSPARAVYTDTRTIYLPHELNELPGREDNILLYKLIAAYQWAFCRLRTFFPAPLPGTEERPENYLQQFIDSFPDPALAGRLYHGLETLRAGFFLHRELPGLMRATERIRRVLHALLSPDQSKGLLADLDRACCLPVEAAGETTIHLKDVVKELGRANASARDSLRLSRLLYEQAAREGVDDISPPLIFQGELHPGAACKVREQQATIISDRFVEALSLHLLHLPEARKRVESEQEKGEGKGEADGNRAIVLDRRTAEPKEDAQETFYLTIGNESSELPDDLQEMARSLDFFDMKPERFVTSAVGRAGHSMADGPGGGPDPDGKAVVHAQSYDEWDYRRNGFRKNWCMLSEQEIVPVRSNFVPATLARYHGRIVRLRHQFEMMRNQERFLRRQRDGDDIDLDALVESLADTRAGLPPSDRLFIRLKRDERDIAVLFLVDMSNSTEGWVGTAIKESLVLLCEAMETLGDRYGIYGFSGMRRLRCEVFHIKHIDEMYTEEVRQRIGAIAPREYTRMAPAIRHMTSLFQTVDARIRLLITLSDGKPEDYDDYKGEYAIEDTRHALLEARSAGIHPFCITIDQHAHDYMAHMYGRDNYIFIDNVNKLPAKMPEVYRVLTT
ncbi:MAG TPA: VWA domain-containing protein [Desulfobulbus sp.]|nr:VWA domain-containing protein [Desulfobulbus sp.]